MHVYIQYEMLISCVPCKHVTDHIIVPDDYQYVHWFCARNVPFHLFDGGVMSLRMEAKGQLCSEGTLECCGCCEVRISSSYCLKYQTCELPSPTLRPRKTIQPILNVMSANGNSSLRIPCPLGKYGEGSLCPHAVQVALATDAWGAVQARPASNGFLDDDQARDQAANSCRSVGKHRREEKLLSEECARAQEGKDGAQLASRTLG